MTEILPLHRHPKNESEKEENRRHREVVVQGKILETWEALHPMEPYTKLEDAAVKIAAGMMANSTINLTSMIEDRQQSSPMWLGIVNTSLMLANDVLAMCAQSQAAEQTKPNPEE